MAAQFIRSIINSQVNYRCEASATEHYEKRNVRRRSSFANRKMLADTAAIYGTELFIHQWSRCRLHVIKKMTSIGERILRCVAPSQNISVNDRIFGVGGRRSVGYLRFFSSSVRLLTIRYHRCPFRGVFCSSPMIPVPSPHSIVRASPPPSPLPCLSSRRANRST